VHHPLAAHARHHDVGHDQIGPERQCLLEILLAVERGDHLVIGGEVLSDEVVHVHVVLDNQHRGVVRAVGRGRPRRCGRSDAWQAQLLAMCTQEASRPLDAKLSLGKLLR
jgi:hypothetical protein